MDRIYKNILPSLINYIYEKDNDNIKIQYDKLINGLNEEEQVVRLASINALIYSNFEHNCVNNCEKVFYDNIKKIKQGQLTVELFESYINLVEKKEDKHNDYISKAFDYIEENIDKQLNLETLAGELHISKNYFSNLFKKVTGMRFCKYVNFRRIECSKKLLTTTDYPLDVIAQKCGYNSQSHFSTTFLNFVKTSPGAYRYAHKLRDKEKLEKNQNFED